MDDGGVPQERSRMRTAVGCSGWTHCLNGIRAEDHGAGVTDPSAVVAVNHSVGPVMSWRPVGRCAATRIVFERSGRCRRKIQDQRIRRPG